MEENYEAYENLANAIIKQAARDYMRSLRRLKKHPYNKKELSEVKQLEEFFHSRWYSVLTNVDPDYLIQKLKEKVRES
jgi:hypothetical protein